MNSIKLLIMTLLASTFVACQPQVTKEVIRETAPVGPSGNNSAQGGVDGGGGGNGVNGKPLEAYSRNMMAETSFKNLVLPIIRKVQDAHPRFASDMAHIALNRKWFFLPVELNKLSANTIGVSFADKDLQQMAIQTLNAVLLDDKLFRAETASEEDRGLLVLHEILMGIRLMKYKNALDNCYSEVAILGLEEKDRKQHTLLRDKCAMTYGFNNNDRNTPGFGNIKLTKEDYEAIRELGLELWINKGEISKVQLDAWLNDKQFRNY